MSNLKSSSILLALSLAAVAPGCARKRAVEKMVDVDGNRFAKASFADGRQWLGRVTIVNNGSDSAFGFVGAQSEVQLGSFRFTEDKLQFVTDNGLIKGGEQKVLNQWSVTHSEYHRKTSGGKVSNVETENDKIPWNEKKYFKVTFDDALVSESITFPGEVDESCWNRKASRVVPDSMQVDAEHINFMIEIDYQVSDLNCVSSKSMAHNELTHTMRYMYSYMPDKVSDYKPYVYSGENDPLTRKYGYFISSSPYLNANGRSETTFYMNRWNTGRTHTFYFAKGFPEQYKWVYNDPEKGVIARTNKLFASNGVDIRFEVKDADEEHVFGDIRYSFFNWIQDDDAQAPLGYGPATAHPLTGEILSANTTMWTSSLKFYLQLMKDKEIVSADRDSTSALYKTMDQLLASQSTDWTKTSSVILDNKDQAALFRYLLPDFTYGNQGNMYANMEKDSESTSGNAKLEAYWANAGKKSAEIEALRAEVTTGRQTYFKREMNELKAVQRNSTVWYLNDAMFANVGAALQGKTDDEVVNDILYRTAIHEFGHNLNLRHNFYGSVDAASRRATAPQGKKLKTTSVMDYLDLESEVGLDHDWEDYDRAALLYAYSNGKIDLINASGDPLLYCTDEHTYSNPLCNRFDQGATPSEIVANMIATYEDGYWTRNLRYGREFWNPNGYVYDMFGTMYKLKKFLAFSNQAFSKGQIQRNLTSRTDLAPALPGAFSDAMNADMQQAVKMISAFYAAVIKQESAERPYQDKYDSVSGALVRHGIQLDKVFAMEMLLGEHGLSVDPNQGHLVTSFFNLLGEDSMKDHIQGIIQDVYINAGDMYVGFDEMGRDYFIANASSLLNRTIAPTESTRISCMSEETLAKSFGLDTKTQNFDSGKALQIKVPADSTGYYKAEGYVYAIYIDGNYYVSGLQKNRLGAILINREDARSITSSYRAYSVLTTGGVSECR